MMLNNFVLDPQHTPLTATTLAAVNDELPVQSSFQPGAAAPFNGVFNPAFGNGNNNGEMFNPMMMQQQAMMMMQMQQMMMAGMAGPGAGGGGGGLAGRIGNYEEPAVLVPPPGGEDPRARKGRVSYKDLDEVGGGGDGGLPY